MKQPQYFEHAFTRVEALAVAGLISLICVITVTSLADNRGRSQKLVCMDNLRQIGQGFDVWRFEHQDFYPWHLPSTNGGSRNISVGLPWLEFSFLSNSVVSPRILTCPSDLKKVARTAQDWGNGPGGFLNSGYRNNSISYTLGLHALLDSPSEFLCSDRNLIVDGLNSICGFSGTPAAVIASLSPSSRLAWTNDVHGPIGNLLINDGSVREQTTLQLRSYLSTDQTDNGSFHLLIP